MTRPDDRLLAAIVEDACRAPSVHNTQPWTWVAVPDGLRLRADRSRGLALADRSGRDLTVSCGAALHCAVVSAAAHGWATAVRRLPDPADPDLLAVLTFVPREPRAADLRLGRAVRERRTDRRQMTSWPVPEERVANLGKVAALHGVIASPALDGRQAEVVARLLEQARGVQDADPAYAAELERWTDVAGDGPAGVEGIPATSLLTPQAASRLVDDSTRFPRGALPDDHVDVDVAEPVWTVLSTAQDDPEAWLRTGEALAAVWLACTDGGLALVPHSQPVEVPATREVLRREVLDESAQPQLVLRIGWPAVSREPVLLTPRRPLADVLSFRSTAPA